MRNLWNPELMPAVYNLLEGDSGSVCGRLEPLLDVGASQVRQWAPLLKPATQRCLHVTVDISAEEEKPVELCSNKAFDKWPTLPVTGQAPEVCCELPAVEGVTAEEGEGGAGSVVPAVHPLRL